MSQPKVTTSTQPMTPTKLYVQLVNSMFNSFRSQNDGKAFFPSQFGGLAGQRSVLEERTVLDVTDIEG